MSEADLNVLKDSMIKTEEKVFRDFTEIENLQNSNKVSNFALATIDYLKIKFFNYFTEKRPNYSIIIKDGPSKIINDSENRIYINCISGIKNYVHGIPYFATLISIEKQNVPIMGLINNYSTNEMFFVKKNGGAFLNNKKLRTSGRNLLDNSIVAIKYDNEKNKFKEILSKLPTFKVNNCSVLDYCNTARGKYDACIVLDGISEELKLGELFIMESGGLTHYLNEEKTSAIFSNSLMLNKFKELL